MITHSKGIVIDIVGSEIGDHSCPCKEHKISGSVLRNDMVMQLKKIMFFFMF